MNASWWLGNLVAYSIQVALVILVGGLVAAALRLKQPRVMLAYWQALLSACLLLPVFEPWRPMFYAPAGGGATSISTETGGADSLVSAIPVHNWLLLVLLAGVGLGLLRLAVGILRLRHYRRAALRIAPLPRALRDAQALAGVEPAFYFSDRVGSPVTFGWLDTAVILPRRFERMDESHQRAIACHELLHVARRDWVMNLLEELILTLFWFHPAIWWVVRSIRLSREQVVDCEVVALTSARKPYLHALLEIAGMPRARTLPAPLFLLENQLARRVASLVKEVPMSKPRLIASLAIALVVVVGTGWWGVKTFWLTAPLGPPTQMVSYGAPSPPGSNAPSTFMYYTVGGDVKAPVPIYKPEPPYTPQARKDKLQGTVVTAAMVDASGNVIGVKLVRGVGEGLDESAIGTLRTWKFKPATKKGKPVPVRVIVEVSFRVF
ncbi:MAG TPA: M56 family metallopeptidase [Terriglobia bacterium]|nr:M56 family metallopeptidase [Terriglobia bacterium]